MRAPRIALGLLFLSCLLPAVAGARAETGRRARSVEQRELARTRNALRAAGRFDESPEAWIDGMREHRHVTLLVRGLISRGQLRDGEVAWVAGAQAPGAALMIGNAGVGTYVGGSPVTLGQLQAAGIGSPAKFDRFMARRVIAEAGLDGDPADPRVVAAAERVLETRIKDRPWIESVMRAPQSHPDLRLVARASRRLVARGQAPLKLKLKELNDSPNAGFRSTLWFDGGLGRIELEVTPGDAKHVGMAAADKAGIKTRAELEALVEEAVARLAPEDIR